MIGTVIFWVDRGWGFIAVEDPHYEGTRVWYPPSEAEKRRGYLPDHFVHYSHIVGTGYRSLAKGEIVELDSCRTAKGYMAINVRRSVNQLA